MKRECEMNNSNLAKSILAMVTMALLVVPYDVAMTVQDHAYTSPI